MKIPAKQWRTIECDTSISPLKIAGESLSRCLRDDLKAGQPFLKTPSKQSSSIDSNSLLIGTPEDHLVLKKWLEEGRLGPLPDEPLADAYEIRFLEKSVAVIGSNPRAALYGAYRLEDILRKHGGVPQDFHEKGRPTLDLRLLHPRARGRFSDYRQTDFEFIARTGGNVVLLQHDWMEEKTLFSFVPCPEFPGVVSDDVLAKNRERMRLYLDWCNLYGLGAGFWLCEMVCQGGPWVSEKIRGAFLEKFPAKVLSDSGTYQGKVLCLAHPLVKQAYRGMIRRLLMDFPELGMFLVFTQDSNAELCSPNHCRRHRGVDKLSQYNQLLAFLQNEVNLIRSDFQVFSICWSWNFRSHPQFLAQQASLPPGAGLATLPDGEAWSFDRKLTDPLREQRKVTRRHNQKLIGYDIFLWGDDTIFPSTELYDFPLGVAAKLRRWQRLGADGVFDQWGTQCEYHPANAMALREMFFDSTLTEPGKASAWVEKWARSQYGDKAGPKVASAWREIELAQQIQSDHCYYWHALRPNWAQASLGVSLKIEALQKTVLSNPEPSKPDGKKNHGPPGDDIVTTRALAKALFKAVEHFRGAVNYLEAAKKFLPDRYVPLVGTWQKNTADRKPLRPGQQLNKQLVSVKLQEGVQRELAHFYAAYALVNSLPEQCGAKRAKKLKLLFDIQSQAAVSSLKVAQMLEKTGTQGEVARQFRSRVSGLPEVSS